MSPGNFILTIDGREVEAAPGQTLLDAARKLGLDIPTLCLPKKSPSDPSPFPLDGERAGVKQTTLSASSNSGKADRIVCFTGESGETAPSPPSEAELIAKCTPSTSCLVCLVKLKVNGSGKLVPSCATKAQPGMVVESETEEVHDARRTALELLLSDHVGDCLSPCNRICPLRMNIPQMIRQIETGRLDEAIVTVRSALALPTVLGRLCHHPCENGCRRGTYDQPAAIREMERHVAEHDLKQSQPHLPPRRPATGKSVVIVGAGPTGLAAAYYLAQEGHACTVIDRHEEAGGTLRYQLDESAFPRELLNAEIAQLQKLGVQFKFGVELGNNVSLDGLQRGFTAVLLTPGEFPKDTAAKLGLAATASGLKVDAETGQTSVPQVFAAGSATKPIKQVVRAISEGQTVAKCIHQFLTGQHIHRKEKEFSSIMGRLDEGEIQLFMKGPSAAGRVTPSCGGCAGFTDPEAATEASRCMHCDCRAAGNCQLQHYAETYKADAGRFREQRRRFEQHLQHGEIIFEPGKCILCGICVQLAEQAREPLGLTFIDRGFDVRVGAPLNHTISEGLQKAAAACVEYCPTGALTFKDKPQANH